jgi:hypothetical protein
MGLERRIEQYLKRSGISPTSLGRLAVNDSNFVFALRKGRKVGESTASKVHLWLDRQGARK